jgi:3-hydroxypropanoate dehydrogenase
MRLDDASLRQLFLDARTLRAWQPREVPDSLLREVVDLMELAPTASNALPARIVLVKSLQAKARLRPHLDAGNVDQTMAAPATAIVAHDLQFYARRPHGERPIRGLADKPDVAAAFAFRNGSLQGAYLIMAARAVGLDCGPMSGFDNAGVDGEFFAGTDIKSNFLCNLGYGDRTGLRPRAGRFGFDEMASIL